MSTKNPFELRFDVLSMAKDLCDRQYDMAQQKYWTMIENAKEHNKDLVETIEKYTPKMYTPTEIMKQAEDLYKFVTKQD